MGDFETWYDRSDLPQQLEWISSRWNFLDLYEDLKSWYKKDFTDSDYKIIKETRNNWCREYWTLNTTRIRILWNRIDSGLFKLHYPNFSSLDRTYIMWTLSNAETQRNFRDIIIRLEHELGELYTSEVSLIESTLQTEIKKKPASNSEIFSKIYDDLLKRIKENRNTDNWNSGIDNGVDNGVSDTTNNPLDNQEWLNNPEYEEFGKDNIWKKWESTPWRIPAREIELMVNIPISKSFSDIKDFILWSISFDWLYWLDESWNEKKLFEWLHWFEQDWTKVQLDEDKINYIIKYVTAVFNDFAKQVDEYFGWNTPPSVFDEENLWIIIDYCNAIIAGEETSAANLREIFLDKLHENDDILQEVLRITSEIEREVANKIDIEEVSKIELTEQEKKDIQIKTQSTELSKQIIYKYKLYKYLSQKKADNWTLDPKLEELLQTLTRMFKHVKKRVLKEVSAEKWSSFAQEYYPIETNTSAEYATWNIKDIKPIAIIENHEAIRDYVYWGSQDIQNEWIENISFSSLRDEDKEKFLKILVDRNKNNREFMDSIKYLDKFWNIDVNKARKDNIDPRSLNHNRKRIQRMIVELAREEKQWEWAKDRINEISIKRSAMICCFRAISSFFDTVNNNWENFASEFEISDVNKDINFDEASGVITMEWVIWSNNNRVKLYYDTKNWTLEFDNYLAYDSETNSYKIWHWNWAKEKININLPTMEQMQLQASSVNLNLIDRLSSNLDQYEHMVWLAMWESIRLNCFVWFMWADIKVSKMLVEQFNEKNILKQDIVNSIYSKFYSQNDMKTKFESFLNISEWNEPEQFKLVELISNTIDNCSSSSELLRFRNAMNELDDILTNNHELVNEDALLQYLFADNLGYSGDITDTTRSIMDEENEDWNTSSDNNIATYESRDNYENNGNKTLNYYLFLSLLSEEKWDKTIINLDCFWDALVTIRTTWKHLLSEKKWLFRKNYEKRKNIDFPDLAELENVRRSTAQELQHLERDVRLESEFGDKLDQAYA